MSKRSISGPLAIAVGLVLAAAGCTSPFSKKEPASHLQLGGTPTFNKPEPSTTQKMGAAIAAAPKKMGNSVKSGAGKVKDWITPDPKPVAASGSSSANDSALLGKKKTGPERHVATAHVYERAGKYEAAADQYEKALKIAPNHLPTLLSYAHLLDRQGKLVVATKLYERAVQQSPGEVATHNDLGLCYARRGMPNDAIKALSKAVQLQPDRDLYRNNLATVLVEQNRSDEALAQLKAVQGEAIAHYNLGYLLQQRGQEPLAATHFQRAMQLDPSLTPARLWTDHLTQRTPSYAPAVGGGVSRSTPSQVASVPAPTTRPVSYGAAPEPGPAPTYLRSHSPTSDAAPVGSRYADQTYAGQTHGGHPQDGPASQTKANVVRPAGTAIPPTPENVSDYRPALGGDLQFLPAVE